MTSKSEITDQAVSMYWICQFPQRRGPEESETMLTMTTILTSHSIGRHSILIFILAEGIVVVVVVVVAVIVVIVVIFAIAIVFAAVFIVVVVSVTFLKKSSGRISTTTVSVLFLGWVEDGSLATR